MGQLLEVKHKGNITKWIGYIYKPTQANPKVWCKEKRKLTDPKRNQLFGTRLIRRINRERKRYVSKGEVPQHVQLAKDVTEQTPTTQSTVRRDSAGKPTGNSQISGWITDENGILTRHPHGGRRLIERFIRESI